MDHYGEGLAAAAGDSELDSLLYANRAQAELSLGNDRSAMRDALRATDLNPANMKVRHISSSQYVSYRSKSKLSSAFQQE